ncbi:hypothetical protein [Lacticaseibacillus parakribbianus]|uniref:hypothetical protein n=1 Tax=Lacticaseibacillus parakribbianus TaxID=2970927 RepID=UPI0021CB509A|nr:hypothetical protein [Lacticaseibacillus parakribbianus]
MAQTGKRPRRLADITYSAKQREAILATMTAAQRAAYAATLQLSFSDRVMNRIFTAAPDWRFVGIRVDYGWADRHRHPERSANLRCVCGRPLRYQYQLVSVDGKNTRVALGSQHFAQHLGIPAGIAQEVFGHFNRVQREMDAMLARFRNGTRFPRRKNRWAIAQSPAFATLTTVAARRLVICAEADLPLTDRDLARLDALIAALQATGKLPAGAASPAADATVPIADAASPPIEAPHRRKRRSRRAAQDAVAMTMADLQGKVWQGGRRTGSRSGSPASSRPGSRPGSRPDGKHGGTHGGTTAAAMKPEPRGTNRGGSWLPSPQSGPTRNGEAAKDLPRPRTAAD